MYRSEMNNAYKKSEKAILKNNQKKYEKADKKYIALQMAYHYTTTLKFLENEKINNMSFNDMQNEKHQASVQRGKNFANACAGWTTAALMASILPVGVTTYKKVDIGTMKTNSRISTEEKTNIAKAVSSMPIADDKYKFN